MNPVHFIRDRLALYASELKNLGIAPDNGERQNFFFGPSIEFSDVLVEAIRNKAVYPALVLEYPDNAIDDNNQTGMVEKLNFGISVISNVSPRNNSKTDIEGIIYGTCKPLIDQVIARLQLESDGRDLREECLFELSLETNYTGMWVGPVLNNIYGFRYNVSLRAYTNGLKYNPMMWTVP